MLEPEKLADDLVKMLGKEKAHEYVQHMLTQNIYDFSTNSKIFKMWNQVLFEISKHEETKDNAGT